MDPFEPFYRELSPEQRQTFDSLDTPRQIQDFLDRTPYSTESANRCPVRVLRDGVAHCLDGGLFAAAALRRIGFKPLVVDLFPEPGTDDDHVLALFAVDGGWGAVAKSNFTGLRFRDPIFRTLRELVMSYFEPFFNLHRQKTLRTYTRPVDLSTLDRSGWMWHDQGADAVEMRLLRLYRTPLLTPAMIASLTAVDEWNYKAGMLSVNPEGLYKPQK